MGAKLSPFNRGPGILLWLLLFKNCAALIEVILESEALLQPPRSVFSFQFVDYN
jgi:hypothetical protein